MSDLEETDECESCGARLMGLLFERGARFGRYPDANGNLRTLCHSCGVPATHTCEACAEVFVGTWSAAREDGWTFSTGHDGDGHTLCPDCQEPSEGVPL